MPRRREPRPWLLAALKRADTATLRARAPTINKNSNKKKKQKKKNKQLLRGAASCVSRSCRFEYTRCEPARFAAALLQLRRASSSPSTPPSTLRQASSLAPYIRRNKASPLATIFASSRCIRHRGATTCNEYCTSSRKTRTKKRAILLSLLVRPRKRFRVRRPAV